MRTELYWSQTLSHSTVIQFFCSVFGLLTSKRDEILLRISVWLALFSMHFAVRLRTELVLNIISALVILKCLSRRTKMARYAIFDAHVVIKVLNPD